MPGTEHEPDRLNTWAPVEETGHEGAVFAVGPHPDDDLYSDLAGALAAIADPDPVAIDVESKGRTDGYQDLDHRVADLGRADRDLGRRSR